jgi:Reverse transcriptase (RNA-dependent DNA polymerase)
VHHKGIEPPPKWEDLVINSHFRNDLEGDVDDTWDEPVTSVAPQDLPSTPRRNEQQHDVGVSAQPSPPVVPRSSPDKESPRCPQMTPESVPQTRVDDNEPFEPHHSTRVCRPVDRFTPDKAHGYPNVQCFTNFLVKCISLLSLSQNHVSNNYFDVNYATALALDPVFGILDGTSTMPPDFLTRNPWMFKAKRSSDPDTPTIKEALTGPYRHEFLDAMTVEIDELEAHGTWTVMKIADILPAQHEDGTTYTPQVVPLTWVYHLKRWPSGLLCKIKAQLCVRGDLQTEGVDSVWDTYSPVASWSSIRMLAVTALQQHWVTKQIDFSNAFVQAPLEKPVCVAMSPMFQNNTGFDSKELCLKLNKSLYGMHEAPKLWHDHLEKGLIKARFTPSTEDPAVYYGKGMAIAVYVDDVLFFGPDADAMEAVITELQDSGFELKREKDSDETAYSFLGIEISESNGFIKFTQHGLIKKFLNTVDMYDCNAKQTPCSTTSLGSNVDGPCHEEKEWEYSSTVGMLMCIASCSSMCQIYTQSQKIPCHSS